MRACRKNSACFPFYRMDDASWQAVRGRTLNTVWPALEHHLQESIASNDVELLQLVGLDGTMRLTASEIIAVGTIDHLFAKVRYVAEQAFRMKAENIILAHNHTSGNATPSWNDVTYTKALHHAFHLLGIFLVDHVIVTAYAVFSMRRNGLIF